MKLTHSAHVQGYAADFVCPEFGTPPNICKAIVDAHIGVARMVVAEGEVAR